ncbi:uncharacterized protein LOC119709608 [Motacilla alba alba]|uniref:uncharacterized protein LOC119709608 n=1 Tax=Motacilla alba alba TaxID=1094192 RepID=UPI0018D50FF6|nr:uncharacterized protein LOC119709608 [Motacilla alba alba]
MGMGGTLPQHGATSAVSSVPGWDQGAPCSQVEWGDRASRALSPAGTLCIPSGTRGTLLPGAVPLHSIAAPGRVPPGQCVRAVSAVCSQSAPEPRAAGPGASPRLQEGERERRQPERGAQPGERPRQRDRGGGTGGQQPRGTRHGDMARLLPLLLLAALGCAARQAPRRPAARDDGADAQRPPARGCANLTLVLDNWKFAITSQLRNLLLSDHQSVLPDYGRIPALSGALDELYRDFRGLKEQLGRLSDRFAHLEASVERLSRARGAAAPPRRGGVPQSPRRAPP